MYQKIKELTQFQVRCDQGIKSKDEKFYTRMLIFYRDGQIMLRNYIMMIGLRMKAQ